MRYFTYFFSFIFEIQCVFYTYSTFQVLNSHMSSGYWINGAGLGGYLFGGITFSKDEWGVCV